DSAVGKFCRSLLAWGILLCPQAWSRNSVLFLNHDGLPFLLLSAGSSRGGVCHFRRVGRGLPLIMRATLLRDAGRAHAQSAAGRRNTSARRRLTPMELDELEPNLIPQRRAASRLR